MVTVKRTFLGPSAKVTAKVTHSPKAVALFTFVRIFLFLAVWEGFIYIYVYVDRGAVPACFWFCKCMLHSGGTFQLQSWCCFRGENMKLLRCV